MTAIVLPANLPQTQQRTECIALRRNCTQFLDLPVEIRLMVYNELMFMNVGHLARRQQYRGKRNGLVTHSSNLDCAQILRTNKQVYHETLPILYSRYTADMDCSECVRKFSIAIRSEQLIEHHHDYVKNIAMTYTLRHHEAFIQIREFSTDWIESERQILTRYKNAEHISVDIGLGLSYNVTFDLVRRSHILTIERTHNYKDVLADHIEYIRKYCATSLVATLIKRCDAVVLSNARGPLKDNKFAVHSIRWRLGEAKEIVLYLGCDEYRTSDANIEILLAKPDREDIGVVRGIDIVR